MAGIQETKWFGKDVWPTADGCTFLHSGSPLPEGNEVASRGEGVGLIMWLLRNGDKLVRYGRRLIQELY